jgi:hypothetical protein
MRILYQLTSPMHKTVGDAEVARRQSVLQASAAAGRRSLSSRRRRGPRQLKARATPAS